VGLAGVSGADVPVPRRNGMGIRVKEWPTMPAGVRRPGGGTATAHDTSPGHGAGRGSV